MPKYYILTLGVSALGPISLESPFDADVKILCTWNATKHSFYAVGDLLAVLGPENLHPCHVTPTVRPFLQLSPKMGENISEMWLNCHAKFHADR